MQRDLKSIDRAGIQLVGISYDSAKVLKEFAAKSNVKYPLLSDSKSKVIKVFGILNEKARGMQAGIPYPMTILLDKDGNVRAILEGTTRRRHTTQELIDAAKKLK